jgi:hypothetical protein
MGVETQLPMPSHAQGAPTIIEHPIIIIESEHGTPHAWSMHESTGMQDAAPSGTQFPP